MTLLLLVIDSLCYARYQALESADHEVLKTYVDPVWLAKTMGHAAG